jgi:hypothetical protein
MPGRTCAWQRRRPVQPTPDSKLVGDLTGIRRTARSDGPTNRRRRTPSTSGLVGSPRNTCRSAHPVSRLDERRTTAAKRPSAPAGAWQRCRSEAPQPCAARDRRQRARRLPLDVRNVRPLERTTAGPFVELAAAFKANDCADGPKITPQRVDNPRPVDSVRQRRSSPPDSRRCTRGGKRKNPRSVTWGVCSCCTR